MKTGIIGLPQVGKTSLFKILTKSEIEDRGYANPNERTLAWPRFPTTVWTNWPRSTTRRSPTHATVEFADVAAIGQEALKETAFLANLRNVDALMHVLRAFEDDSIPHVGAIDPLRDIKNVEFDLMVTDLAQIEKRLERLEKDLKKMRLPSLRKNTSCCCAPRALWKPRSRCAKWR